VPITTTQYIYNYSLFVVLYFFFFILTSFLMLLCCTLDVYLSFLFLCTESLTLVSDPTSRRFIRWLFFQTFIYIYNTVWFNFQTYIIFIINLVSQVTLRSSGTDILYGCHLLRCLYNILYFLWLYNDLFIILYNILKIAELDCCQIIILSIYVPSTHA
jgi:hypothetical protein